MGKVGKIAGFGEGGTSRTKRVHFEDEHENEDEEEGTLIKIDQA
jgi:hypothetical protein